jgi:hypothetical protein
MTGFLTEETAWIEVRHEGKCLSSRLVQVRVCCDGDLRNRRDFARTSKRVTRIRRDDSESTGDARAD